MVLNKFQSDQTNFLFWSDRFYRKGKYAIDFEGEIYPDACIFSIKISSMFGIFVTKGQ